MDERLTHLQLIQGVIGRMGANSFYLKGWSVTLIAALFALAAKDSNKQLVLFAYCPIIVFWGLDAFFLRQEKLFRKLYEEVAKKTLPSNLLSMDTLSVKTLVPSFASVVFSKTLVSFHGVLVAILLIAMNFIL